MKSTTSATTFLFVSLSPKSAADFFTKSSKSSGKFFSTMIRNAPNAARRNANGSALPFGAWPMPKIPVKVSNLSAKATALATSDFGNSSPAKRGIYCSFNATATSSSSPS